MNKHLLSDIESKLDALLTLCAKLESENESLRAKERAWEGERARLIEKNEKARTRVEAMIVHLKNLSSDAEQEAS
jgi:cell division protein ZapB